MGSAAYLTLDVAGTPCALPQAEIREILALPRLDAPPAAGGPVAGLMNLAGEAVPVIDLAVLLGLRDAGAPLDPDRHVVVGRAPALGLLVDRALDVVRVPDASLRPAEPGRSLNGCVAAAFPQETGSGTRLVHVLSLARLLTGEERARLDALTARARARLDGFPALGTA